MPLFGRDRYQRLDGSGAGGGPGRKPSSFCSSATVVVFVALCLVAAWMMASSNNIPVSVSPENKSEAKEEAAADMPVDVSQSVKGGGGGADDDTPRTGVDGAGAGSKGDGNGDDAPQTSGEAGGSGKKDDDGAGETTRVKGDEGYGDKTGEGDGATRTTDAGGSDVAGTTDATSGGATGGGGEEETSKPAAGGAVAEGETASKNQTFSDENGKTEGGEVAKPEDPEKKVEQSAEEATTGGGAQADKNTDQSSEDTGGQADKSGQEASTTATNGDSSTQDQETPTDGGGGMAKNQTIFDDSNGKVDGAGTAEQDGANVAEKSSDEAASSDKEETATDKTAPRNGTQSGDLSEAMAFAAADDTNGTIYQDAKSSATSTNSSSSTQVTDDDGKAAATAAEKAELLPSGQADLLNETASAVAAAGESTFPTQAAASSEEKKKNKKKNKKNKNKGVTAGETETTKPTSYTWKLCNTSAGADYIPCLDNTAAIRKLKSTKHYEHRERHCPSSPPSCLVPLPEGYKQPIPWPHSRDKIWYHNVPHASLAHYKGHQNWVKVSGEHLTFPGGGTQFKNGGAGHYADLMEKALSPELLTWGKRSRVVLDVGCGVASFGGALFDRDALTMSFAPKDEHEAQTQFALERGIPAVSAVMGTLRLPFPGGVFDVVHCARCRVPWHIEGGKLLLEVNRLLRPGGLFVWSATPVYRKVPEDVQIWHAMTALTKSMCWEMVKRTSDTVDQTAMVVFRKPTSNACYDARRPATTTRSSSEPQPPMCEAADDPDAAWNVTLQACMHRVPTDASARGSKWPAMWPERLRETPYWLGGDGRATGVYGKPAPEDFAADMEHWRKVVENSYVNGLGIDWKNVRNVMDMRAVYGGFAAALGDMKVWVMNVVPVDSPDTLPIIYERGLFGMYHDWCESFSTYPRSYDLLHADHLFSGLKTRCLKQQQLLPAVVEVDRILRPGGTLIVRDDKGTVEEVRSVVESMRWEVRMTVSKQGEELLCVRKTMWRPTEVEALS
ncbi:hypothetical protein EJB05_02585 [Eragrostis curvula]|uniref:Methyltransferase n=1 Tax=Eragrostis curvula TaxID=38414 RepID=A0A5J9WTM3_9POAL|nr:hypothetical protein EJB05_02585 [Eragrostis curvula]